jgi:hypothetical protein
MDPKSKSDDPELDAVLASDCPEWGDGSGDSGHAKAFRRIAERNARLLEPSLRWPALEAASLTFEGELEPGENVLKVVCPWTFRGCQASSSRPWGVFLIEKPENLAILGLCLGRREQFVKDCLPMPASLFEGVAWGTPKRLIRTPYAPVDLLLDTAMTGEVFTLTLRNNGPARSLFAQIHGIRTADPAT